MKTTLIFNHIGVAGMNASRKIGDREGSWIGHGVASIGAYAKSKGFDVDLIDLRNLSGYDQFEEIIRKNPSDVYGLSVSAVDRWMALKTILVIKRVLPDSKIIVGGIHPTIFPGEYEFDAIDCVVQGEGEISFSELLNDIDNGKDIPKIVTGIKPDLDRIPWVDRELFDYHKELYCTQAPDQETPSVTMLAGRGCAFKCSYCQPAENAVFGHPYRMRSPQNVIKELLYLKGRYHYKSITFWDDTFTFRNKWVQEFCDLYEASGIGANFVACSRADIICNNELMVKRLAEVGCNWFIVGLESGSQRLLDLINKGTTVEQNKEAIKICKSYGIKVFGTLMFGLPTETQDDSLATARMIDEASPAFASPFWFIPIEGTNIYKYCAENDLILNDVKNRTIERTNHYEPTLKGVDYDYIKMLMKGYRGRPGKHTHLGWN